MLNKAKNINFFKKNIMFISVLRSNILKTLKNTMFGKVFEK